MSRFPPLGVARSVEINPFWQDDCYSRKEVLADSSCSRSTSSNSEVGVRRLGGFRSREAFLTMRRTSFCLRMYTPDTVNSPLPRF